MVAALGYKYDSDESIEFIEKMMKKNVEQNLIVLLICR